MLSIFFNLIYEMGKLVNNKVKQELDYKLALEQAKIALKQAKKEIANVKKSKE